MKKSAHHLLYIIAKAFIQGFEAVILVFSFIASYIFMDLTSAIYAAILCILLIPIAWDYFNWPERRQNELKLLRDIYEEERSKF